MSLYLYDVAVIVATLGVALGLLVGAKELAYEIRRRVRRRRVRAEMGALPARQARARERLQRWTAQAALSPLPAHDAWDPRRDPVIGVDQANQERRRAAAAMQYTEAGIYVDELMFEQRIPVGGGGKDAA
jgi:hypothetical protein